MGPIRRRRRSSSSSTSSSSSAAAAAAAAAAAGKCNTHVNESNQCHVSDAAQTVTNKLALCKTEGQLLLLAKFFKVESHVT